MKARNIAFGIAARMFTAKVSYWLRCASSVITTTSDRSVSFSLDWNFWMRVNTYRLLPRSKVRRCSPLEACDSSASAAPTAPTDLKVFAIWSSSSTRSVTTTNVQLPVSFRRTFWAKNTIARLLPLPWVCQNTPARPCFSVRAFFIDSIALFTPRNWWFWLRILTVPSLCSEKRVKFSTRSRSRPCSHVPRMTTSRATRRGSSSLSTRFHSLNRSQSAVIEPTRLSMPLLAISRALYQKRCGTSFL